ncbi:uncharacterized protein LOC135475299 [Liolophura sinensis]|uniref:uncharacterized protein LOC135475299 n=1 Tax=Liolophura sinensis TaxID=3198878 RepID=UPI003158AA73
MVVDIETRTNLPLANGTDATEDPGDTRVPTVSRDAFTLADSVAAVTIAILASTVLITIICIIRLLRKRRQQQQGEQLNGTPAVYASTLGANVMAYHNLQIQMQNDPSPSWEPVQVQQADTAPHTPNTNEPTPSTSYSNDDEVPVISIISIHNNIQQQQNINAGYLSDNADQSNG